MTRDKRQGVYFTKLIVLSIFLTVIVPHSLATTGYEPVTYDSSITFSATMQSDGTVVTTWSKYNHSESFSFYKVVRSQTNNNPIYPDDGYIYVGSDVNDLSYTDTDVPSGQSYYRICHIASPQRYCSSTVVTINKGETTNTNSCTDTSWIPETSSVCSGVSFTQTSNCGNTKTEMGTKSCSATNTNSNPPKIGTCQIFPSDNPWNKDISTYPVHPNSVNYINSIGNNGFLHADFGGNGEYGIPYVVVDNNQSNIPITFTEYGEESDAGPYPIPLSAPIEGGPSSDGDRHVLAVNKDDCMLYELYHGFPQTSSWNAGSGAKFNLTSNALRPEGWTSADAAGLPIFPGLARYDEVVSGSMNHALRFTVSQTQQAYIHPATHYASSSTDPSFPPMGLRLRLKSSYNISSFTGQSRIVLETLKKYGMIVADNGSNWYITGASDTRWNDEELNQLKTVPGSAFEVVYTGNLIGPSVNNNWNTNLNTNSYNFNSNSFGSEAMIIDHTSTTISNIPSSYIEDAKEQLKISYGHTSHGSQIVSGMESVEESLGALYSFNTTFLQDYTPSGDLGNPDRTSWADRTRSMLQASGNDRNVVMWSWCGQVSDASESDINTYLSLMNQLEQEFPNVTFIYMTGHLDGTGESGNLHQRNEQIRNYVRQHNKVLFDFADIESYDPSGNYFLNQGANDNNDYSGGNWSQQWCSSHSGDVLCHQVSCAHSQSLNCNLKGRAFWSLMAQLAGWDHPVSTLSMFRDVSINNWASSYIEHLFNDGIIQGRENGLFYPESTVTRAEFVKMVMEALFPGLSDNQTVWSIFSDVTSADWFAPYIITAFDKMIVTGYSNYLFRPNGYITRAEAVAVIAKALQLPLQNAPLSSFLDVVELWQKQYIEAARTLDIIGGYNVTTFGPNDLLTRAQAAKIVYKAQMIKEGN